MATSCPPVGASAESQPLSWKNPFCSQEDKAGCSPMKVERKKTKIPETDMAHFFKGCWHDADGNMEDKSLIQSKHPFI